MSASSKPTRKPRSRRTSARLSAVVDFPTPPLPEATAMTAAIPGISDCFDIGDAGLCGGRCDETGGTPCALGGGGARRHHFGESIENLLLRYAQCLSPVRSRQIERSCRKGYRSCAASGLRRRMAIATSALLPGGLIIQFDHHAIGVV